MSELTPPWPDRELIDEGPEDSWLDRMMWYALMGLLAVIAIPLLIVSAPVWIPLAAVGWLVEKVYRWWFGREPW